MVRFSIALLLVTLPTTLSARTRSDAVVAAPTEHEVIHLDLAELDRCAHWGRLWLVESETEFLLLDLERVELNSENIRLHQDGMQSGQSLPYHESSLYRGKVLGDPASEVRLSVVDGAVRGYIRRQADWLFIMAAAAGDGVTEDEHWLYSDAELDPHFFGSCDAHLDSGTESLTESLPGGAGHGAGHGADHGAEVGAALPTPVAASYLELELAVDVDREYFLKYGASSTAQVQAVLNEVEGIFQTELGLTITVVAINIWSDEPDPYTATDASSLLVEMLSHWNTNNSGVNRDLAHLFSGKDLDGSTVGVGYLGVLCNQNWGYALSQDLASAAIMPILVAHEIGHNLGANHDALTSDPRYVMYPSLGSQNLDQFSADSKAAVQSMVAGTSCLSTVETGNPPPPAGGGGGGGGGPVDPLLLLMVVGGVIAWRRRGTTQ